MKHEEASGGASSVVMLWTLVSEQHSGALIFREAQQGLFRTIRAVSYEPAE